MTGKRGYAIVMYARMYVKYMCVTKNEHQSDALWLQRWIIEHSIMARLKRRFP